MTYEEWFLNQAKLHETIMKKLENRTADEIVEYFKYENMKINEPDFCPLYTLNKKCHEMENLNCYLCACPNFRFKDDGFELQDGKTLYSKCGINSKDGSQYIGENYIHQNCSGCIVPHRDKYIKNHFSRDWFEVMKDVRSK